MGRDRMDAARLLQQHNVIVRGGPQEGKKLLDALVVSPSQPGCGQGICMSTVKALAWSTGACEVISTTSHISHQA